MTEIEIQNVSEVSNLEEEISKKLLARRNNQSLRKLELVDKKIDFCSNDYLGLANDRRLSAVIDAHLNRSAAVNSNGSTGSRLISGNSSMVEDLEAQIADFHLAQAALIFSTGYGANTGLFECIVGDGDTLITDRLIHASSIDGVRLSKARRMRFQHNDIDDLKKKLQRAHGSIVVGIESVYSMDGDEAPLQDIVELAEQFGAAVIVDEAHSVGIAGPNGAGLVQALGLENRVFARVCTFGKALGLHGAAVVGSHTLKSYLINYARSFIYSTAPSPHSLQCIAAVYDLLPDLDDLRKTLNRRIDYFRHCVAASNWSWLDSNTAIQSVIIPGNDEVRSIAAKLRSAGLGVVPIVAPTVPKGTERIRLSVHAFNTEQEIDLLFSVLKQENTPWVDSSLQA